MGFLIKAYWIYGVTPKTTRIYWVPPINDPYLLGVNVNVPYLWGRHLVTDRICRVLNKYALLLYGAVINPIYLGTREMRADCWYGCSLTLLYLLLCYNLYCFSQPAGRPVAARALTHALALSARWAAPRARSRASRLPRGSWLAASAPRHS